MSPTLDTVVRILGRYLPWGSSQEEVCEEEHAQQECYKLPDSPASRSHPEDSSNVTPSSQTSDNCCPSSPDPSTFTATSHDMIYQQRKRRRPRRTEVQLLLDQFYSPASGPRFALMTEPSQLVSSSRPDPANCNGGAVIAILPRGRDLRWQYDEHTKKWLIPQGDRANPNDVDATLYGWRQSFRRVLHEERRAGNISKKNALRNANTSHTAPLGARKTRLRERQETRHYGQRMARFKQPRRKDSYEEEETQRTPEWLAGADTHKDAPSLGGSTLPGTPQGNMFSNTVSADSTCHRQYTRKRAASDYERNDNTSSSSDSSRSPRNSSDSSISSNDSKGTTATTTISVLSNTSSTFNTVSSAPSSIQSSPNVKRPRTFLSDSDAPPYTGTIPRRVTRASARRDEIAAIAAVCAWKAACSSGGSPSETQLGVKEEADATALDVAVKSVLQSTKPIVPQISSQSGPANRSMWSDESGDSEVVVKNEEEAEEKEIKNEDWDSIQNLLAVRRADFARCASPSPSPTISKLSDRLLPIPKSDLLPLMSAVVPKKSALKKVTTGLVVEGRRSTRSRTSGRSRKSSTVRPARLVKFADEVAGGVLEAGDDEHEYGGQGLWRKKLI